MRSSCSFCSDRVFGGDILAQSFLLNGQDFLLLLGSFPLSWEEMKEKC
ncbi:hypothetical protein UF75_1561 [Desulfosporosinus sp. I2]|nr:hypothetical protein UF75_1561 [Desulfosporosinus sp. I2]